MKNIITLLSILFFIPGFSQSVKKEKLNEAKSFSDIVLGYPAALNHILDYASVNIQVSCEGKILSAQNNNDLLNAEQKNILSNADQCSDIEIKIKYSAQTLGTDGTIREMNFIVTVLPDKEAVFPGGPEEMTKYFKRTLIDKFANPIDPRKVGPARIKFSVNENGEVIDGKISNPSFDPKIDELLLEAINKMPKWKPAETAQGLKIKQHFNVSIPLGGC
ncbi:MAG TPA: energy transducer TonB [Bacteroidia bacterium]|jgi:TonB family protein|nr:energy transducer TonB [Bacteroidia bacterium]